jgi:hypothetical protein
MLSVCQAAEKPYPSNALFIDGEVYHHLANELVANEAARLLGIVGDLSESGIHALRVLAFESPGRSDVENMLGWFEKRSGRE